MYGAELTGGNADWVLCGCAPGIAVSADHGGLLGMEIHQVGYLRPASGLEQQFTGIYPVSRGRRVQCYHLEIGVIPGDPSPYRVRPRPVLASEPAALPWICKK
jgi:hypothetical protein